MLVFSWFLFPLISLNILSIIKAKQKKLIKKKTKKKLLILFHINTVQNQNIRRKKIKIKKHKIYVMIKQKPKLNV